MNFKKWVKSIQTAGYNGARTVNRKTTETTSLKNDFFLKGSYFVGLSIIIEN